MVIFAICSSIMATPVEDFSKQISSFSLEFYQQCIQSAPDNIIISPYSVANALVLLSQAAGGNSFEEIKNGLHLSGEKSAIPDQFLGYSSSLKKNAGNATFSVANEIFVQDGKKLNKNFEEMATQKLLSGVKSVDFTKSVKAAQTINHFVEETTHDKIKDLVSSDAISGASVVLVNAIYMKAKWQNSFESYNTFYQDFYNSEDEKVSVEIMHLTEGLKYGNLSDLDASAIELKYHHSDLALLIILPNSRTGLSALETKLKGYDLTKLADQLSKQLVKVAIPKFKIEHSVNLKDVLLKMGMGEIFSNKADLSGLLEGDSLAISDAIHKAYIEVNEEGTEAAAATGVVAIPFSALIVPEDTPQFRADHPFVYHIWDTKTKTILFSGHIAKLNSSKPK